MLAGIMPDLDAARIRTVVGRCELLRRMFSGAVAR